MADLVAPHHAVPHLRTMELAIRELSPHRAGVDEADFQRFTSAFLRRVEERFVVHRGVSALLAALLDLYRFVSVRPSRDPRVRVFNPTREANGYDLDRTVVETCMPDQPFLFDTLRMLLRPRGLDMGSALHPIVPTSRDGAGRLLAVADGATAGPPVRESLMHLEIDRIDDPPERERLRGQVDEKLRRAQAVVDDFSNMRGQCLYLADHLHGMAGNAAQAEVELARDLLRWLTDENYVFMGYQEFAVSGQAGPVDVTPLAPTRLGLFRAEGGSRPVPAFPDAAREWLAEGGVVFIGKGDRDCDVHRPGRLDLVAVRVRGPQGWRVLMFAGLYTRRALLQPANRVPLLRDKVRALLAREDAPEGSYLHRTILDAVHSMPMEYLLQADTDQIETSLRLIRAAEDEGTTVVHALIPPGRPSAYVLVSFPRDHYDEDLRQAISARVRELTGATYLDDRVSLGEHANAVLQVFLTAPSGLMGVGEEGLKRAVLDLARTWEDRFEEAVTARGAGETTEEELARYLADVPEQYRQRVPPDEAAEDFRRVVALRRTGRVQFAVYPVETQDESKTARLKMFSEQDIYLSHSLPVLSYFGLRVIDHDSYGLGAGHSPFFLDSFRVQAIDPTIDVVEHADRLDAALRAVYEEAARSDRLSRLVLTARLDWKEVAALRAYIHFNRQLGDTRILEDVRQTWIDHPQAAALLIELFRAKFKPDLDESGASREAQVSAAHARFVAHLAGVESTVEDRTLRRALGLVSATVRTNFYSRAFTDGHPLSFKVDSARAEEVPTPRPFREIFVYHTELLGVHLRGGPVARGGLRWSDRPDDFRTEVLGLMQTQMTKNVLIVPVGAKGGFVLRKTYGTPQAARKAADDLYKVFIRGLLDVTDNYIDGAAVPPDRVIRYDGDDPYLVVAADKGTAHLSDTANGISAEYGFWLGDAFASGGSRGYDHKALAITAKGAWECVKRHFRELGVDPEKDIVTVTGIGDMSGDVFGNGLMLSRTVKLVAVFNHMHIFLDPDPDPARSFEERVRLFHMQRSAWGDYDRGLLSKGGGVYPRHSKRIELSPEARRVLGVEAEALSGDEVVKAILRAEVDLLWNGGIGTYIKASWETHRQADDAANDGVRVDGNEVRARVVGEGGNLGFTQAGRVEYSQKGGRVNTDAVDNSGGVDTSDHEVNLKILFQPMLRAGGTDIEGRDRVLRSIVDRVCADVLRNNYLHSELVSLDDLRSKTRLDDFSHLMAVLQTEEGVDLRAHRLPDEAEVQRRRAAGEGLLRPELCKLSPFTKMRVYRQLVEDEAFAGHYLLRALREYFPPEVRGPFALDVERHLLRREIAATVVCNRILDGAGCTFFQGVQEATSHTTAEIALAYLAAADLLGSWTLKDAVHGLDGVARASVQYRTIVEVEDAVAELTRWLLSRGLDVADAALLLDRFSAPFDGFAEVAGDVLPLQDRREIARRTRWFTSRDFPQELGEKLARVPFLPLAGDVALLAERSGLPVGEAATLWFETGEVSRLGWAATLADTSAAHDGWDRVALLGVRDQLRVLQLTVAARIAAGRLEKEPWKAALRRWTQEKEPVLRRIDSLKERIDATKARGLAPATVVASAAGGLAT